MTAGARPAGPPGSGGPPGVLGWYARRLRAMSVAELGWRAADGARRASWSHRRFAHPPCAAAGRPGPAPVGGDRGARPAGGDLGALPPEPRRRLLAAAEAIVAGRLEVLGVERHDLRDPSWSLDPRSGERYPEHRSAFRIDHRSAGDRRDVKQVWELSRHHHLTVLACAWRVAGDDRFAATVDRHLRSWWERNPVCRGVAWSSGIELGIRLVAWAWVRRLLDGWPGAPALFEENPLAVRQIYWHQRYLAAFRSRGSSANNHVVAEAAGRLVAACAFPWYPESARWQVESARLLDVEVDRNTFPDGVDREQAFDYHGLVAELGLVAAAEARARGRLLAPATWERLCRMVDVVAATADGAGRPPRYGDGDDGRGLVVNAPEDDRWASLLALGAAVFGPLPWWPATEPDAQSILVGGLAGRAARVAGRPAVRPSHFEGAGLTILRSARGGSGELWCRCDAGPHGFLSIAAHAHADALSVEVRHGGVEILADPGTYCYHTDPAWRRYFRSTVAHNTLELDGEDQSVPGGPFLWVRHARTERGDLAVGGPGRQRWSAEHDGYLRLAVPARHRRTVVLDPAARTVSITDQVRSAGSHAARLAFHLGPEVAAELDGGRAVLAWTGRDGRDATATLHLPPALRWAAHRGSVDPPLGWYSPGFGRRVPATTLVGAGTVSVAELRTELRCG